MEFLVSGNEEMEAYIRELSDIPVSGITIVYCKYRQSAQLVEKSGCSTYLNGSLDFGMVGYIDYYTEGYRSSSEDHNAYLLSSDIDLSQCRGRIKELVEDILLASSLKIDLSPALERSRKLKEARIQQATTGNVIPVVEGEVVSCDDKDYQSLSKKGIFNVVSLVR